MGIDWNEINCRECGKCNKKGLSSAMKGSAYCSDARGLLSIDKRSFFAKVASIFKR